MHVLVYIAYSFIGYKLSFRLLRVFIKPAAHGRKQFSKLPGKAVCVRISPRKAERKIFAMFDIFGFERQFPNGVR